MTGIEEIAAERKRQVESERWSSKHDDQHTNKSLALAAALYAAPIPLFQKDDLARGGVSFIDPWPWWLKDHDPQSRAAPVPNWDKRQKHSYRRRLAIAGALLAAEIDRLDRAEAKAARKSADQ